MNYKLVDKTINAARRKSRDPKGEQVDFQKSGKQNHGQCLYLHHTAILTATIFCLQFDVTTHKGNERNKKKNGIKKNYNA